MIKENFPFVLLSFTHTEIFKVNRSWGQRSRSVSGGHVNLVNSIAPAGDELIRFTRSSGQVKGHMNNKSVCVCAALYNLKQVNPRSR